MSSALSESAGTVAPVSAAPAVAGPRAGMEFSPLGAASMSASAPPSSQPSSSSQSAQPTSHPSGGGSAEAGNGRPSSGTQSGVAKNGAPAASGKKNPALVTPLAAASGAAEGKGVTPVTVTPQTQWVADFGAAWYDKYFFRGLDILKSISPHESASGILDSKINLALQQERWVMSLGFDYIEALEKQIPAGAAVQLPPNPSATRLNEHFRLPSRERYSEYDLYLKLSYDLIPNQLRAVAGFNRYMFSDGSFYAKGGQAIHYADETTLKFEYLGIPAARGFAVTPSLEWAHDYDGFEGDYFDLRVDGDYQIYKQGLTTIRLDPYASVSYDMSYNGPASSLNKSASNVYTESRPGPQNGWNAFALGLNIPIRLGDNFTISLSGNYNFAIEDTGGQARATNGFWGGMQAHVGWGGPLNAPLSSVAAFDGKSDGKSDAKLVQVPPTSLLWEVGTGGAGEAFRYSFDNAAVPAFPVSSLGLPSTTPHPLVSHTYSTGATDRDTVAALDLSLSRELWRSGDWSLRLGLEYEYTRSEGDSGISLARLDAGTISLSPTGTVNEALKVATFVNSKVSLTSNRVDFPIKLRHDFGKRLHAELGVALTLNLPNEDLTVNAYERALTGETTKTVTTVTTTTTGSGGPLTPAPRTPFGLGSTAGNAMGTVILPSTGTTVVVTVPTTTVVPPAPSALGSGKGGAAPVAPQLPGVGVGHQAYHSSSSDCLVGVSGSAALIFDLNAAGTLFTTVWARYDWANDFALGAHVASSTINRNGPSVGLGLGYRF